MFADIDGIIGLCDQFIEQALATDKEVSKMDRRFLDEGLNRRFIKN